MGEGGCSWQPSFDFVLALAVSNVVLLLVLLPFRRRHEASETRVDGIACRNRSIRMFSGRKAASPLLCIKCKL